MHRKTVKLNKMADMTVERHLQEPGQDGPPRVEQVGENVHQLAGDQPRDQGMENNTRREEARADGEPAKVAGAAAGRERPQSPHDESYMYLYMYRDTYQASSNKYKHKSQWAVKSMTEQQELEYEQMLDCVCNDSRCAHKPLLEGYEYH